jgi:hypothetical protein
VTFEYEKAGRMAGFFCGAELAAQRE